MFWIQPPRRESTGQLFGTTFSSHATPFFLLLENPEEPQSPLFQEEPGDRSKKVDLGLPFKIRGNKNKPFAIPFHQTTHNHPAPR
jgi:hypothetical protein